ncbi:Hep/Hag repeat protein [Veillonella atypica ACS-134-V-Col7a]|uniref:Hep/Hag repeat protein n=1 Tax=Veillonella atypica ACS-134-V-Col7a TaxID=866778 RepID=E1LA94_9FIRM|nr:ESPR-type extended signal peptide-containing protein [Veillonella atypica]EFL58476.1 Hep/Hag repeat protein [Veillonella atypica ACS-134-V-Col7a]
MKHVLRLEFEAFTNMENLIEQHCNNKDYNCVFFQRGFIDSMNKIFKVVWSKTKECYVVVSEVAKNNSGKKKVLASVLAALAVIGAGAAQVDAASFGAGGGNAAADASISIGGGYSGPKTAANDKFAIAIGDNASATGKSSISMGYKAETNGQVSIAIGEESKVKKSEGTAVGPGAVVEERFGAAFGHEAKAQKEYATAIGSGAIGNGYESQAIGRQAETTGIRAVAVGTLAQAKNDNAIAIGNNSLADGTNSIAMGKKNKAHSFDAIAIGNSNNSRSSSAISIGSDNTADVAYGLTDAQYDALPYDVNNLTDSSKTDPRKGLTSAIAIGRSNKAANVETVAIGREVNAMKTGAIGMGSRINATGDYAIAIGNSSGGGTVEAGNYAVAVGFKAKATGGRSIAQGGAATAAADRSIAMGLRSNVQDQKASSTYTYSGTGGAVVGGVNTTTKTIHKGTGTATANDIYDSGDEIAIGTSASVSDESNSAVVIGNGAKTEGNAHYSVVVGKGSYANASDGVVVGQGSYVNARESIAIGQTANVSGTSNVRSQAIGFGATVSGTTAYDALAIGSGAQVTDVTSGVALGSGSDVSRKTSDTKSIGLNTKYVDGTRVRNRSYEATVTAAGDKWDDGAQLGAVSVGNDNQKRQIINVAAGNQDTDAVNVAQLKNVGVRVGADTNTATINGQKVAADFLAYNGQLNIKGDNNRVTTVSENDTNGKDANVNVKFDYDGLVKAKTGSAVTVDQKTDAAGKTYFEIDAAAASKTVLADGKNTTVTGAGTTASPYKVNVEGALTGISSITNNTGGKIEFTTSGTTISGGPVNVSNNKITGVANGDVNATSTDAVNGSQLHAVKTAERHIAPTTTGSEYTVDSNGNVTMTYLDGNNNAVANEKAVIKGIAKNDLSNITNEGKKEITKLGTIVKAGDNVNVSESSDTTTGRTTYTVNAVTPAVYTKADGTKVYKRPDGTFTTNSNLAAGNNVDKGDVITSFMDGNGNTTGGNMVINNVGSAIKNAGNAGDSFLTKLDAANTATPNAAVNVSDLKNTADGLTDKGLKFDANEGGVKTNKLGSTVTVQGSGTLTAGKAYADEYNTANIRTKIEQGTDGNTTINVGLAKELKGINSISNGNSSITLNSNPGGTGNTPAVSITGGNVDVGGNNITNLKSGGDVDSNAANIGDVKKIASDTDTHIKPGTYTVAADKTVTMTYVNGKGETVQANGQDVVAKIDLSGLPTGGTSSTEKVQKAADANGDKNIADVNPKAGDTFGAADATYEVSVSRNAVKDAAREAVTVNNGGTTKADGSYTADTNNPISVTPTKDDNNHNTSYAVTFDGNKAAKQIPLTYKATNGTTTSAAQTVTLDKGLNFTGGDYTTASVGADGKVTFDVNLGTAPTVTDGKPGVPGQAGATGKDGIATVKTVVDTINNSGWKANAKANGGKLDGTATATVVKPGNTVNYAAGKNLIVNQELEKDASNALTGNQTYTYSLNKDIDLTNAGSLTVGDTTVNNGGITIKAPTSAAGTTATTDVKLTNTGLDNGGNKIVNVKAGDVSATSTDAVNGSQLHAVKAAERHIKPDTYAVDGNGKVTMKYVDGDNQDVTGEAVITGIAKQDLSNINNAGKNVITGLGTIVKAGDNVNVSESSDATTGQKTYTVNAVTPAVYTTPDGTKLTKDKDGKFHKEGETAEYTGDIITSFENPKAATGQTTKDGGMIVNNIGSAIKNQNPTMLAGQTATYLDKLKAAADAGSNVKNAAVNVSDLHNTAEALKSNELHIRPTVTNRTDETVNKNTAGTAESYKYDATTKSVILKYNDGTGAGVTGTEAKIDLSDLANQITSGYTFKTNATENGGKVVNDAATPAAETAVANGGVVNYAAGKNLTVKQDIEKDGTGAATGKQTYTYALADEIGIGEKGQPGVAGKDGVDGKIGVNGKDGSSVVINGKDGSIGMTGPQGKDGKDGINGRDGANISMTSAKGEQVLINRDPAHSADTDKAERIVYVPKDASGNPIQDANGKNIVREVATMDDGLKFTGNNESTVNNNKLNTLVKVQGEGTKEGTNAAGAKEVQTSDGTKFESAKDNIAVVADGTNTLTVKLNKKLKGLDSVQTKTVELGDHTTPGSTTNITYNTGDNRIEYTTPGTTDTKKVATTDDIWTIQGNGTDVAPVNGKVNVKAGENILITTPATADGSMTINAVTPAVYTDKDGNKLTKDKDGKFHKDDGTEVAAADVITSIQDAAGNTTGGHSIVNNVGSAINNHATPGVTSPTYLDKLDAAAGDTKTQNAAVNVTDLKNTADGLTDKGLNFTGNNESTVNKHKLGSLVKVQGEGTKEGTNAAGTKEIQTSDGTKFESAKDNIAVEANNGDTLTVKLNKNLKGLDSVQTKTVELGDHTRPGGTTNITYNTGDNRIEYTTPGTTDTKKVATTDDIWTIQGNGTDVAPVNGKVNVKAGENILITTPTTADGSMTINAVTPAIYTDKNGNKVVKRPDGTYTTNLDGSTGNDVAANDVIVSFKDAAGNTTGGNSIINNVGSAIKNQTPTMPTGVTATYLDKLKAAADDTKTQNAAVNVSDLHNTANALRDNELHIAPTAVKSGSTEAKGGAASGNTNPGAATQAYKYNATTKQVELTFNDGNGNAVANTKAVIDLSNLPTGGDMSSFHVTSSAESTTVGTHVGDTTQEIKDGKSIDFQAGKNMTVTQTNNSGNTVINYALDKNLDVESVHVGKDGKDGKIGIDGKDGVDGLNGTNRVDIHVEKGAKGVDGTDGHDGVNGHNGKDGMTRIVYEDKGGKQEVATLNDGLKFTGNNESTVNNHKLNTLVKVQGEGTKEGTNAAGAKEIQTSDGTKFESAKDNIAVVADGTDTLTVKLNKNLKGLDSVQTKTVVLGNPDAVNGTTNITYNPTDKRIEYVTPDAAGTGTTTNKVANLDDEKHIKAGSYAVQNDGSVTLNYQDGNNNDLTETAKITGIAKQDLSNIDNAGKTVITGLGTIVKAGDNVTVSEAADATTGQKTYTVNAVTPAIYTDKNGNKVVKRPDGTYTTNLDGSTGNDVAANDVIVSFKDAAGNTTGGNSIVNNVGSAIKNQTPTMPAGQTATYLDKLKAAADDTKTQNAAVNVSDLHNTANALKDSELHIAPTAVKSGSTEAKGGVASGNTNPGAAAQAYKYNATTKQVELTFNDGNGKAVTGPKAVIDLSELAGSIQNYGFKTNAAGNLETGTNATETAVASGKTVTYAAGKNLTVKQEIGTDGNQTYTYALNKDLTNLDKVVVNGKDGQPGKDGVSITGPKGESAPGAKDGQDGKVGIAGKDGKDAVSISGKDGVGHIGLQGPKGTPGTPGADGASLDISTDHGTQTLVKPEANNDNKSERIVYVPKDKDGNPLKDTDGNVIKREVATMDDGLKFAGDDGTVIKKALGTQLDIVGGATGALSDNNIGVNNDNGKLKVQLAKKIDLTDAGSVTTGNTKVNNDGITITNPTDSNKNVSLTGTGLNNGGNKITNVKAGENPTDAVNVQQLKDNVTTVESSDSSIKVVDKNAPGSATYDATKGHQYDITINNQSVVEHAQTPVVYTDKDGHKLYKIVDPTTGNVTFNTKEDGTGTTVQPNEVIASMNNGGDSTTTPMKLNNVGSSIQKPNSTDTFLKQLDDANKNTPNGAVNVSDLKKTSDALIDKGLVFDANNADPKTNKLGSKVTIAGTGALANGENFADKYDTKNIRTNITQDGDGNTTVEIGLTKNLKGLESVSVPGKDGVDGQDGVSITGKDGANGIDGKVGIGKDGKDAVSISGKDGIGHIGLTGPAGKDGNNATADITVKEGKAGVDGKDGITRIVYNDKDGNEHQVATHDDGLKFTGNNVSTENKHKLNSVVKVQGEGVIENATSGKLEVNGQEFKSAAGNIAVVADGDKTLTVKMNKDLNLTKDGSVTMGDTVVNNDGITIKAPTTSGTTDVKLTNQGLDNGGNKITNVAAGTANTDAVNVSQLKGSITTVKSSDGSITVTDANAGSTDPTKGHAYDIKVNNQGVVNNAQIPVVYTKDDGTKVYKQPDGTFNTAKDGSGDIVAANKVIASMNNAANSSTDPTKLQNVGSSIADKAGNTYLDKINAAAGDNHAKTGAVNVSDLKNTADAIGEKGLNFGAQSGTDIHKNLGEKLEIVGGGTKADDKYDASNIKTMTKDGKVVIALDKDLKADSVTVGEKGAPGKDGVDGKIGVNGIDGSAVVINGKDGSIGLNGKDGANGITIKGDKGVDGVDGVNGTNGITRIVYQDKDGNNHEVATHDDGMKFAGDDGQTNQDTNPKVIKKHLNKVVDIVGGADKTKLTDNNIGVNNDGGKLRVQLANELSGINKISNGNSSISIADVPAGATSPAVTISGGNLSMGDGTANGNHKIVNLAAGTNDTDAVNYKQLKDSRTTVTSKDGSVTITPTHNGDSTNYDLKVNPPLDPRVDQLAEEIGRVGAQGAALSALKPIQYDPLEPTQIMAGYGNYRGNSAIAMGVAHYKNESTLIHGGISWAGGSSHMMANAGVTWKVGNRDSEAAVADRYRKGPISSAYAMQQEMAAMKAQNAGLKGEVSDLKAENEQMKAQIAAMMAKLGL